MNILTTDGDEEMEYSEKGKVENRSPEKKYERDHIT